MIKLGIKVGPQISSVHDLSVTKPDFCEVWFHVNRLSDYSDLMSYIKDKEIATGLHFWGATTDNYLANIAYDNKQILDESLQLIKKTIDFASLHHCFYVNIHPGNSLPVKVDLTSAPLKFAPAGKKIPNQQAFKILMESLNILSQYAADRNVEFYLESTPINTYSPGPHGALDRQTKQYLAELPLIITSNCFTIPNLFFTNDIGHTASNIITNNRLEVYNYVLAQSQQLRNKTKLLHVSFIVPPYNGVDYHGSFTTDEIYSLQAVPNFDEMQTILNLYKNMDVGALIEPFSNHIGNFKALKNLVMSLPNQG